MNSGDLHLIFYHISIGLLSKMRSWISKHCITLWFTVDRFRNEFTSTPVSTVSRKFRWIPKLFFWECRYSSCLYRIVNDKHILAKSDDHWQKLMFGFDCLNTGFMREKPSSVFRIDGILKRINFIHNYYNHSRALDQLFHTHFEDDVICLCLRGHFACELDP